MKIERHSQIIRLISQYDIPEIVGSIAGDNTLMCVARSADEGLVLMEKIRKMIV